MTKPAAPQAHTPTPGAFRVQRVEQGNKAVVRYCVTDTKTGGIFAECPHDENAARIVEALNTRSELLITRAAFRITIDEQVKEIDALVAALRGLLDLDLELRLEQTRDVRTAIENARTAIAQCQA